MNFSLEILPINKILTFENKLKVIIAGCNIRNNRCAFIYCVYLKTSKLEKLNKVALRVFQQNYSIFKMFYRSQEGGE